MRISEYIAFGEKALKARKRVLAIGAPGVGKTQGFYEACRRLDMDMIALCSPLLQPTTVQGYPYRPADGSDAGHCLFDGIARAFRATRPTCLFFDDLPMASESVMKAILQLVYEGRIDDRKLPEHVVICAAGNDVGHGAGVVGMIEPLKGRFHTIVTVEPHVDDTVGFGLGAGWPAWLLGYLRNSPDALCDWKPEKSLKSGGANPRAWNDVAEWDNLGVDDPEVWSGCVGKGRATEASAFKSLQADLPDIDQCIVDPDGSPVPENPSARFLVAMAMASKMGAGNFGQALKYLQRMPSMFRAFSIRDAFRAETAKRNAGKLSKSYAPIASSRDFTAWVVSSDGKEIMQNAR